MFSFSDLSIPLIQAPMAGGPNTPEMIAAVVNAGGVGSYGFAYSAPEKIAADLAAAQVLIDASSVGAVNANFFVFQEVDMPEQALVERAIEDLVNASSDNEVSFKMPRAPYFPDLQTQLEPVWEVKPEIVTFHFGIPGDSILARARSLGIAVGITATCAEEAKQIETAGADFIVAQGIDAGGHRGIFDVNQADEELSIYDLLEELSTVTDLPLIAAGGIMTRAQIEQAFNAGASAVQLGTAFLTSTESGASPAHKRYLLEQADREARTTLGFSGRPARGIDNQFMENMAGKTTLPFPLQNTLTGMMRADAVNKDDGEFQSLWAGSNFAECREESVEQLIRRLFT